MKKNLIKSYFEADHDRLDLVFRRFQGLKRESYPDAKPYFKVFFKGLKRHIVWEEDVLFPIFEQKMGLKDEGPTFVMRQEHRRIGEFLNRIHEKVRQADVSSDDDEEMLIEVLEAHNFKEEQVLYPALDQMLTEDETAQIFMQMEMIPAERYETCCGSHAS